MTGNPSQTRNTAPYASLRAADASEPNASGTTAEAAAGELTSEGNKLKALREALWAAFEAGPSAGLPNTLIDLTMAYTGALRLQLNLKALAARHSAPRARPSPNRNDPNSKS